MSISDFKAEKLVVENDEQEIDNYRANMLKAKQSNPSNDTEIRFKQQMKTWPQIDIESLSEKELKEYIDYIPSECIAQVEERILSLRSGEKNRFETVREENETTASMIYERIREVGDELLERCKDMYSENGLLELHSACDESRQGMHWVYCWRDEARAEKEIERFDQILMQYKADLEILKEELERRTRLA